MPGNLTVKAETHKQLLLLKYREGYKSIDELIRDKILNCKNAASDQTLGEANEGSMTTHPQEEHGQSGVEAQRYKDTSELLSILDLGTE